MSAVVALRLLKWALEESEKYTFEITRYGRVEADDAKCKKCQYYRGL